PERNQEAMAYLKEEHIKYRIIHLVSRLFFRGIYFPQMSKRAWLSLIKENRRIIYSLVKEGTATWRAARKKRKANLAASANAEIQTEASKAQ
ncbi:MAG TPA: hypothetical protein VF766_14205, partial [Pyrinomonadaceae bacterium]